MDMKSVAALLAVALKDHAEFRQVEVLPEAGDNVVAATLDGKDYFFEITEG